MFLWSLPAFPQTGAIGIRGVSEPPELSGPPKKVEKPSEADAELYGIIGNLKEDEATVRSILPKLDAFISKHPDYSDALFLRATCKACFLNSRDFTSISDDVNAAMAHSGQVYNTTDHYSLLGKTEFAKGNYSGAITYLEKAMRRDLDTASRMFNSGGVAPEKTSKFCVWNLTELDELVKRFPTDYRVWLFRGLYYLFFTTFKEDFYPPAMQDFQKAALAKPESPLPQFFIGQVYSKASFWTKKAWASDEGRDEQVRNAAKAYTKAIQLDPSFLRAYKQRAGDYLNLKQYQAALKDYDKILSLDPENTVAYSDRGLAKLETGQYWPAIFDFGEAIRRKKDGDSYLPDLYTYRGDARVKLGQNRDAITDYSKAIALKFGQMTILLSIKQIRDLYPEYDHVSDDVLYHKIHDVFWPNMEYAEFVKQLEENGKWDISLLNELYEKRGDAYLQTGDFRRGAFDFQRIFVGIPNFADSTDRWREIGKTADGEAFFLDVKTADFASAGVAHLWIKTAGKKESQTVAYELDCKGRRMNTTSSATYDSNGNVLNSSEAISGWHGVIPDTIGEQIYNGACSQAR
jgi:tetratricopeptide (TPR) repeat protein